ncbi:MAG: hypothetical protein JNN07_08485 [Verrucomicrobiales bacterium]|nr:hypothetical protein [Verrucomicrobiales bacterium]
MKVLPKNRTRCVSSLRPRLIWGDPGHATPQPNRCLASRRITGWWALATTALLALITGGGSQAQAQTPNPIVVENALPGTPQSTWSPGASVPTIRGFTSDVSVNKGEDITFYIQTPDGPNVVYDLVVYRLGYYQGNGAREVARFTGTTVDQPQCLTTPTPSLDPATDAREFPFLIDCGNWTPSLTWSTPADLVSGLFMAKVQRRDTRISCGIFFVIRDDARASDILLQTSDTTWQAYNYGAAYQGSSIPPEQTMDGHCVYDALNRRAYKVSTRRPHLSAVTNIAPPHAQVILENTVGQVLGYGEEYPLIRFLEANGFDVSYTTGKDSDQRGELIRNHRLFISSGHDEYWSLPQMRHVEAARDAGVNLAFFSGNTAYWKIRWEDDHKTMVVFKEQKGFKLDPLPGVSTGLFRDSKFGPPAYDGYLPENGLLGLLTSIPTHVDHPLEVPEADGKLRFWRNTSVANMTPGQVSVFDDLLGYEIDGDLDNGFRPPGLFHLSTTELTNQPASSFELGLSSVLHHMSLYRASSGALVFSAGTMRLQRALAGFYSMAPRAGDPRLQQAIVNLFADMNVQPATLQSGLTLATASTDQTPPTAQISLPSSDTNVSVHDTVFISGSAADGGGRVAAVEVSTDGGTSWHPAKGRESWSYAFTPCDVGVYGVVARAVDDSGNIGLPTSVRSLVATLSTSSNFVANGLFDCGFDEYPLPNTVNWIARGWFQQAESGRTLVLTPGGLDNGVSLQRVVAAAGRDGIAQNLTLVPGQRYALTARVFLESGAAVLKIGSSAATASVTVPINSIGRWQTLSAEYSPSLPNSTLAICSDAGPAVFKVDDVVIQMLPQPPINIPPTISAISSRSINEDGTTGAIVFTLADVDSPVNTLQVTPTTSNPTLIPVGNITMAGTGAGRTVTVKPAANQSGSAIITLTVADASGGRASSSFTLTVNAVNDAPTITSISARTINEDGTAGPIAFTLADVDSSVNTLTVTPTTSNSTLVPVGNIVVAGTGASRTVTVKPAANRSGSATITLTVADASGGRASSSFTTTVIAVNDPPTITTVGPQTIFENGTAGPLAFRIADVDSSLSGLRVSVTSSNTALVPTANIAFGGLGGNRTITIRPVRSRIGTADVTIKVTDSGGRSSTTTFRLTVVRR